MLLVALICYILYTYFNSLDEQQDSKREHLNNVVCYVNLGLYYILFCTAHWVFSMRYWIISYRLNQGKMLSLMNLFYYLMIAVNVIIPIYATIEMGIAS